MSKLDEVRQRVHNGNHMASDVHWLMDEVDRLTEMVMEWPEEEVAPAPASVPEPLATPEAPVVPLTEQVDAPSDSVPTVIESEQGQAPEEPPAA